MKKDFPLAPLTTFGIKANTKLFVGVSTIEELVSVYNSQEYKSEKNILIMGGGSNMLFTKDFEGLVIHNRFMGISVTDESANSVLVKAGAGENWHQFVTKCVEQGFGGIENLSLIPGTVGASPVQNIGAYGVELKDVFVSLEAFDFQSGEVVVLDKENCKFGYRESIFKQEGKGRYMVLSVTFRLTKPGFHKLKMNYGDIKNTLQEMEVAEPSIQDISKAVITIRSSKLPDPKLIGNAGSFFKNPEIPAQQCRALLDENPLMPTYDTAHEGFKKVAAGWLIEQCGWKGKSLGNAAVHSKQALVLTNPGNATGLEVKQLADAVQKSVFEKFGIKLEMEVNIL